MKQKKQNWQKKYGIKAYGKWFEFDRKADYLAYLNEWIAGTDGSEQERAVDALTNLMAGIARTDTDAA